MRTCTNTVQVLFFDCYIRHANFRIVYIINLSGDKMIIYADILIFINTIIDYILLTITSYILKKKCKLIAIICASLVGGISSIYIFIDSKYIWMDFIFKTATGILLILIAFGFSGLRTFILRYVLFLLLSFSLSGLILFLQNFQNTTFFSRNLISYVNISPVLLIFLSAIFYLFIKVIDKIIHRKISADFAELIVELGESKFKLTALIDSGHTLTDPLSDSQIIIIDNNRFKKLVDLNESVSNRIRLIPVSTISDSKLVEGIRCDKVTINIDKHKNVLMNPIVIPAAKKLGENYNALISKSAVTIFTDGL